MGAGEVTAEDNTAKLRIDKWLWQARFFKTRSLAAEMVGTGHLRLNGRPIHKPGQVVKPGDVLVFPQGPWVRVIEIVALGSRRGPAEEAKTLYKDLDPPQPKPKADIPPPVAEREKGAGRPTKKERRAIDAWTGEEE